MEREIPGYKGKKRERLRKPEEGKKPVDPEKAKKDGEENEEDEEELEKKKKIKKAREKSRELEKEYNPEQIKSFVRQPKQKGGQ